VVLGRVPNLLSNRRAHSWNTQFAE
jgi:hypothetical protein